MIKTLSAYIGQYKKDSVKAPFYIIFEVLMEILIPFVTASIIDKGIQAGNMKNVYIYGKPSSTNIVSSRMPPADD
mgnify:CR=1 FL=1